MPTTDSAAKRARLNKKKKARNKKRKKTMKKLIKEFEEAVKNEDLETSREKLRDAKQQIAKLESKGILHKNTAARKKSKLDKRFNQLADSE